MESKKIRESVSAGMDVLTSVSEISHIENAPSIEKAKDELHAVGLGAMNLHGYLAKNGIPFESEEARDFARTFFMIFNYESILRSSDIAIEKGESFVGFEESEYGTGVYFDKYLVTDYSPQTERVKELFEGMFVPSTEDWKELCVKVRRDGLYHGYRLAIAPTQSISYIQNSTSSVMPVVEQIETRTYANAKTSYPMPYLSRETYFLYKSAYDMNQFDLLDLIAEIQPHIDQGISTILYVNSDVGTDELARYYIYAHKKGLKSLYYTRTRKLDVDECVACAV